MGRIVNTDSPVGRQSHNSLEGLIANSRYSWRGSQVVVSSERRPDHHFPEPGGVMSMLCAKLTTAHCKEWFQEWFPNQPVR